MKQKLIFIVTVLCSLSLGLGDASAKGKGNSTGKGNSSSSKAKPGKGPSKDKHLSKGKGPSKAKGPSKDKGPEKARGPWKDQGPKDKGPDYKKDGKWRTEAKFRDKDRTDCVSHWDRYKGHPHGLPPGLAKNLRRGKPLPPGWQKKLHSGWIIDDGSWGLFDRVPGDYLPRDHKLPRDTGMYLYGDRLVRVHEPTREVVDHVRVPTIRP